MDKAEEQNSNSYIRWDPKFKIGIPVIDSQHQKLVELCNNLHESIMNNQSKDDWKSSVMQTLEECTNYAQYHFSEEEKLMKACCFEGYIHHKTQHDNFKTKMNIETAKLEHLTVSDAFALCRFLYDWVLGHIAHEDRLYVKQLVEYLKLHSSK